MYHLSAEAWIQSHGSPRGIYGVRSGMGTDFFSECFVVPCQL
jgi:hypothetical protein